MICAADFSSTELVSGLERDLPVARVPGDDFGSLGSLYGSVNIYWFPTQRYPLPCDSWLAEHMATPEECIAGVRKAFSEYESEWCGAEMRPVIRESLSAAEQEKFDAEGWLPFLNLDGVYINASADVLSLDIDCDIDYNLSEHGIRILRVKKDWKFGYAGDDMEYFWDWNEPAGA